MDTRFGHLILRIKVHRGALGGSFRGHWAVYEGPPDEGNVAVFEDYTDDMLAFAPAEKEARAQAVQWVGDHLSSLY